MPITLPGISRRRFVLSAVGAGVGVALGSRWAGAATYVPAARSDAERVVLLSDLHIGSSMNRVTRGVNLAQRLQQAVGEILASGAGGRQRPSMVIVNGDCSLGSGKTADYVNVIELLSPLRRAGLPVHLGLGNHDNRERFWAAIPAAMGGGVGAGRDVGPKRVLVLETPRVDWVVLDSLEGWIGGAQLRWLAGVLDEPRRREKPVMVVMHHHPRFGDELREDRARSILPVFNDGLADTEDLVDVVARRRNVKALIFGHTHVWSHRVRHGIHLINLPTTAYVFDSDQPAGWVDCAVRDGGARFTLRALDARHPKNGQAFVVPWQV